MNDSSIQPQGASCLCLRCKTPLNRETMTCPSCGYAVSSTKILAGVLGILLGGLGIHKFVLGMPTAGIIMLCASILTCGMLGTVTGIIGLIEGIIYLTMSDEQFYNTYVIQKKEWF